MDEVDHSVEMSNCKTADIVKEGNERVCKHCIGFDAKRKRVREKREKREYETNREQEKEAERKGLMGKSASEGDRENLLDIVRMDRMAMMVWTA